MSHARMPSHESSPDFGRQQPGASGTRQRALIRIDDRPIRKGLLLEIKKLRKNYDKLRAEIERHETVVRPAFYAWFAKRFGSRASLIEQLRMDYQKKFELFRRMRELYLWRGMTRRKAYAQAKEDFEEMEELANEAEDESFDEDPEDS